MTARQLALDLKGCRILVTGGSRGIAAALVAAFSRSGADVCFSYSNAADTASGRADAATELVQTASTPGVNVFGVEADFAQPGAAKALVTEALRRLGQIDILVLSASVQVHRTFLEMPLIDVMHQFQVNLIANIETLQAVLPGMRERRFGRIISIGSVQETVPSQEMPIYSMTKSALENLVRNLAVENAPFGITVNNIAPGLVQTDRNEFRRKDMDDWRRVAERANPMRRAGQPDDIVGAALFLASDAAAFVTGTTIAVTGGAHISRGSQ